MIFVTVGTQLPFERLLTAVDNWVVESGYTGEIFAQIGDTEARPKHIQSKQFLTPSEYANILSKTTLVISHAGMGTVISCLNSSIPVLVLPRMAEYGEHRNDHQIATCKFLKQLDGCYVANNTDELIKYLNSTDGMAGQLSVGNNLSSFMVKLDSAIHAVVN